MQEDCRTARLQQWRIAVSYECRTAMIVGLLALALDHGFRAALLENPFSIEITHNIGENPQLPML